ncbi:MAG TPA: hypothetical protein PK066_04755, partial [Saprospiraceae bacterium]|nr:hypothetical protein [Saprospiraceae bacterium]
DGTVVWACYLMLFRTYGTGMLYPFNLLRMVGPDGTGMGARFIAIPYLRHGHAISMQFATHVWSPWDRGLGMLFNAILYLRHGHFL